MSTPLRRALDRLEAREPADPAVLVTWLRYDDVECVRCDGWAGPEGGKVYVVDGEGCVCTDCVTDSEAAQAVRR